MNNTGHIDDVFNIPALGFDVNGQKKIGRYLLSIDINLDLDITNEDGKIVKTIQDVETRREVSDIKKMIKQIYTNQLNHLEYDFSVGNYFNKSDFEKKFIENPIMRRFANSIVWGVYLEDLLVDCFHYRKEGFYVNSDNEKYDLLDNTKIGIVHPIEITKEEIEKWNRQLKFYNITQPFTQIYLRTVYIPTQKEKDSSFITTYKDKELSISMLLSRLQVLGWKSGQADDNGFYSFLEKDFNDIKAYLHFEGKVIKGKEKESGKVMLKELSFNKKIGEILPRYVSEAWQEVGGIIQYLKYLEGMN